MILNELKSFKNLWKFDVVTVGIRAQLERIRFTSINAELKSAAREKIFKSFWETNENVTYLLGHESRAQYTVSQNLTRGSVV